jgi:hypothetical protein
MKHRLGYFATRVFEGIHPRRGRDQPAVAGIVSRSYTEAGAADASYFETLGALAINGNFMGLQLWRCWARAWAVCFFCYLLFRVDYLVPRFFWRSGASLVYANLCNGMRAGDPRLRPAPALSATIPGGLFAIFFGIWTDRQRFSTHAAITIGAANTAGVVTPIGACFHK